MRNKNKMHILWYGCSTCRSPHLDNLLVAQAGRSTSSGSSTAGISGAGCAITLRAHCGKSDSSSSDFLNSHKARSIFLPCCSKYIHCICSLNFVIKYNVLINAFHFTYCRCTFFCVELIYAMYTFINFVQKFVPVYLKCI